MSSNSKPKKFVCFACCKDKESAKRTGATIVGVLILHGLVGWLLVTVDVPEFELGQDVQAIDISLVAPQSPLEPDAETTSAPESSAEEMPEETVEEATQPEQPEPEQAEAEPEQAEAEPEQAEPEPEPEQPEAEPEVDPAPEAPEAAPPVAPTEPSPDFIDPPDAPSAPPQRSGRSQQSSSIAPPPAPPGPATPPAKPTRLGPPDLTAPTAPSGPQRSSASAQGNVTPPPPPPPPPAAKPDPKETTKPPVVKPPEEKPPTPPPPAPPKQITLTEGQFTWDLSPILHSDKSPEEIRRLLGISGEETKTNTLRFKLKVNEQGKITNVTIVGRGTGSKELDAEFKKQVQISTFKPYKENGVAKPFNTTLTLPYKVN